LIAMVLAQPNKRAKNQQQKREENQQTPVETDSAADATAENTSSSNSMGPIGAGIGFCVCFAAVVVYLCRKDYLEKIEEKEKAEAEAKKLEEAAQGEEQKPTQVGAGDGVELASLETCSTPGDAVVADRV